MTEHSQSYPVTNHVSVLNDAIGVEAASKARSALRLAGYCIYKGLYEPELSAGATADKPALGVLGSLPSGESDPLVTTDSTGAGSVAQGAPERRTAQRLADVVMMLDAPDAYNRGYIAAVCRSILSSLSSTDRGCEHKSVHDGPRVEVVYGTAPTQVCPKGRPLRIATGPTRLSRF
jgi:hypothetical protein